MQRVPVATLAPGSCTTCGSSDGPFVDTLRVGPEGEIYVCERCVQTFVVTLGLTIADPGELAAMGAQITKLTEDAAEHERFREAVVTTLREGAVVRHGKISLRSKRGQRAVDV
jgi:hypothetical protein